MNIPFLPDLASDSASRHPLGRFLGGEPETLRCIYLFGEIDDPMACSVTAQLHRLDAKSDKPIHLFISSPGGSAAAGFAIYDCLKHAVRSNIVTVAVGRTASIATLLLAAGTEGMRYAAPNAQLILSLPRDIQLSQTVDPAALFEPFTQDRRKIAYLLARACGKPFGQVLSDCAQEHRMHAADAKEYGLVDHVAYPRLSDPVCTDDEDDDDDLPFELVPRPFPLRNVKMPHSSIFGHVPHGDAADFFAEDGDLSEWLDEEDISGWLGDDDDDKALTFSEAVLSGAADRHVVILLMATDAEAAVTNAICAHTDMTDQQAAAVLAALPHSFSFPSETAASQFVDAIYDAGGYAIHSFSPITE